MKSKLKKTLISSVPYVFIALFALLVGESWGVVAGIIVSVLFVIIGAGLSSILVS